MVPMRLSAVPLAMPAAATAARWVNTLAHEVLNSMSLLISRIIDAGITNLKRAVALGPDLLPLQLNLAKALARAGRGGEARTQLDTLLPRLKEGTPLHGEALALQKTL